MSFFRTSSKSTESHVNDSWYKTCPLDGGKEIRLFQLTSRCTSEILQISVQKYSLDHLPPFECISYTWGNPEFSRDVYTNRGSTNVTINLWHALQRIRGTDPKEAQDRRFWADQICIDQSNETEKNQQVPLMSSVFPSAHRVLCWLGSEQTTDRLVHDAIGILKQWASVDRDDGIRRALARSMGSQHDRDHPRQRAIQAFFSRAWFSRVWTLQEVYVDFRKAPLVLCPCCSLDVDWESLRVAFVTMNHTLAGSLWAHISGQDVKFVVPMLTAFAQRDSKTSIKMSTLLQQTAERGVTKPRDRVYGLLGIMEQQGVHYPPPDYGKRVLDATIFKRYTRAIVEQEQDLQILSFKKRNICDNGVSSWSFEPQNMTKLGSMLLGPQYTTQNPEMSASGPTFPILAQSKPDMDDVLGIFGVQADTVSQVFRLSEFLQILSGHPGQLWQIRWHHVQREAEKLARQMGRSKVKVEGGNNLVSMVLETLSVGEFWTACPYPRVSYETECKRLYNSYLTWGRNSGHTRGGAEVEVNHNTVQLSEDDIVRMARGHFQFRDMQQKPGIDQKKESAPDWMDSAVTHDLFRSLSWKLKDMQLATTHNGHLALVPHICEPGDRICVLSGGYFPLALREVRAQRGDSQYRLLGPAYVQALMNGAGMREYVARQKRSIRRDVTKGLELFSLV